MTFPDIEKVAEQVHAMWMTEKIRHGKMSHVDTTSGEELMVPYHKLSEHAKDYDRATVRMVYAAIVMMGDDAR